MADPGAVMPVCMLNCVPVVAALRFDGMTERANGLPWEERLAARSSVS